MDGEGRIPDEALVVRGGTITGEQLRLGCSAHVHHPEVFGFSVQSAAGFTVAELARAGEFPHSRIGVTTVGGVRSLGHDVVRTRGKGDHATVTVAAAWSEKDAVTLAAVFVNQANPVKKR